MRRAPLIGVEHEFEVLDAHGAKLDMRRLIARVDDGVRGADPDDPLAVRHPTGGVVTADGAEAEIATPPIRCSPTAIDELLDHLAALEDAVGRSLGEHVGFSGYSTHISVEVADRRVMRVADEMLRRWTPGLVLMTQYATSPGLLVRPRWRRLEFGCEHLEPRQLARAVTMCVGATAAVLRGGARPPIVRTSVAPSRQRFGRFVAGDAFGTDVLQHGRSAVLLGRRGRRSSAQDHLERSWELARPHALRLLGLSAVRDVDDVVTGVVALPVEEGRGCTLPSIRRPVERLPHEYRSGDLLVRPCLLTWRLAVFSVRCGARTTWVEVPGAEVRTFLRALHAGCLDAALRSGRRVSLSLSE